MPHKNYKGVHHDIVLDRNMLPLAYGTREEILAWIELHNKDTSDYSVRIGQTIQHVSIPQYLEGRK